MLPQFGASKLSTDCDNSQRFNSYLRVHSVHCKRTCPFAPPSHASLSHTRPLKMTCLVDTQPLSQNRSSAIAAHTDDFIHTAVQSNRRPTLIRIVSVPTSRFRVVWKQIKDLGMGVQVVDGTVTEDLRRLVADFSNAPRGVCQRAPSASTCRKTSQ